MAANFPLLIPEAHPSVTMPRHPHVSVRATGGRETRIRLANLQLGAKLPFTLPNIETTDLLLLLQHWRECRGTSRDFQITSQNLGAITARNQAILLATTWKYATPPKVVDICGGRTGRLLHTVSIELISQPRRIAAYLNEETPSLVLPVTPVILKGGWISCKSSISGGLISINGGWKLPGGTIDHGQVWVVGGKFSTGPTAPLPGADLTGVVSLEANGITVNPPTTITGSTSIQGGVFTLVGDMTGGEITGSVSLAGGVLTIPAQQLPGGAIVSTASLQGGLFSQVMPGASITATTSIQGGVFSTVLSGATITTTATIEAGSFIQQETDPNFASVSLLLHCEGANNSTAFTDSSSLNHSVSASGGAVISTAEKAIGSSSLSFPSGAAALVLPTSNSLVLDGDFTIEWRVRHASTNDLQNRKYYFSNFPANTQIAYSTSDGGLFIFPPSQTLSISLSATTWTALALSRTGSSLRWFKDGELLGSATNSSTLSLSGGRIGNIFNGQSSFTCHYDEIRITKGVGRYTATYGVRTTAFPDA